MNIAELGDGNGKFIGHPRRIESPQSKTDISNFASRDRSPKRTQVFANKLNLLANVVVEKIHTSLCQCGRIVENWGKTVPEQNPQTTVPPPHSLHS